MSVSYGREALRDEGLSLLMGFSARCGQPVELLGCVCGCQHMAHFKLF